MESKFGSLRGNGPQDRSLGRGAWTTARGGAKWSPGGGQGRARPSLRPRRASRAKFRCPARTEGLQQERLAPPSPPGEVKQREAPPSCAALWDPIVLAPPSIAQALGGPACARRRESKPHRPSFLLLFLAALPSSARAGSEERRAHRASRAWPPALVCRELTKGTSGQRVSAQWRELQFISILLLFDIHTPALFTTK